MAKRRRVLPRSWFKRQRIGHVRPGIAYRVGNSFKGLRSMARWFRYVDRDLRKTKDGQIVVTHWGQPGVHDRMTAPGIPRGARIEHLTWAQVATLRGPDGLRIHTVEEDIALMGRLHLQPYFEPKAPKSLTLADWQHVVAVCREHGVKPHGYALRANRRQIPLMRAAGIKSAYVLGK